MTRAGRALAREAAVAGVVVVVVVVGGFVTERGSGGLAAGQISRRLGDREGDISH